MEPKKEEKITSAISKVIEKEFKEIKKVSRGGLVNDSLTMRNLALSLMAKINDLYENKEFEELERFNKLVSNPVTKILDISRKANEGAHEMAFGKKIDTSKRGGFEEELDKMIDITPEKVEDGSTDTGKTDTESV